MDDKTSSPNEPTPLQEVGDALRPAVEQVCAVAPPPDAVERSIDHAQRLGPPMRRRRRRVLAWSAAAAGIAAVVLVGYGLWPGQIGIFPKPVAWNSPDAADKVARSDAAELRTESEAKKKESDAKKTIQVGLPQAERRG